MVGRCGFTIQKCGAGSSSLGTAGGCCPVSPGAPRCWALPAAALAALVPAGAERGGGEVAGGEELVLTRSPVSQHLHQE